jgi:hypothetical protein
MFLLSHTLTSNTEFKGQRFMRSNGARIRISLEWVPRMSYVFLPRFLRLDSKIVFLYEGPIIRALHSSALFSAIERQDDTNS